MYTMPQTVAHKGQRAFSLIELLVVVAITAVLAAVVIATLGAIREQARLSRGVANLKQIGNALHLYAVDNDGKLPYSWKQNVSDWGLEVSGYIQESGTRYSNSNAYRSEVFTDPSATIDGGTLHYSAHQLLMPTYSTNNYNDQVKIASIQNPSELVIVADSAQKDSGMSPAGLRPSYFKLTSAGFGGDLGDTVPLEDNKDGNAYAGNVRYRMKNNTAAKFLFVDGHVEVINMGELKYRNTVFQR